MNTLRPDLMWIENRCYRLSEADCMDLETDCKSHQPYGDREEYCDEYESRFECIEQEDNYEIKELDSGKFSMSFHVPQVYYYLIIGQKGATKQRLEKETGTRINVPRGHAADIVISGFDQEKLCSARRKIEMIVMSGRQKKPFTHFISIPMNSASVINGFLSFKDVVIDNCNGRGIESSIFQIPEKLHLTLDTLVLMDAIERKQACDLLQDCGREVIDKLLQGKPIKVKVFGIHYMNDDPSEVDVLYAGVEPIDETDILQELCDRIVGYFAKHGFVKQKYDCVKLHVTVMNTLFRREKMSYEETNNKRKRETFDARNILEKYHDFDFGEHTIDSIHLSQRYSTVENGYYQSSAEIKLLP